MSSKTAITYTAPDATPTTVQLAHMPTLRQTFFVASVLVVGSLLLGMFVDARFVYVAFIPGIGMMIAATTGVCPMTLILERMPWNRKLKV